MSSGLDNFIDSIRKMQPKFSRLYSKVLSQAGLTQPQYVLLLELLQSAPEPMSMTAISQKLYISKPAVTSLVDRLEKNGFLKRLAHPNDRRVYLLAIQSKGQKVAKHTQERILKLILHAARQFNEKERTIIKKFYALLSGSIDEFLLQPKGTGL